MPTHDEQVNAWLVQTGQRKAAPTPRRGPLNSVFELSRDDLTTSSADRVELRLQAQSQIELMRAHVEANPWDNYAEHQLRRMEDTEREDARLRPLAQVQRDSRISFLETQIQRSAQREADALERIELARRAAAQTTTVRVPAPQTPWRTS